MIWIMAISWCLLALSIGAAEAAMFYYKSGGNTKKIDEHFYFSFERFFMWIPFELALYDHSWLSLLNGVFLALTFVFMHDGFYYFSRNQMDGSYPMGWWSQSITSTSWMDRKGLTKPVFRTAYAIVGITGLIIINYVLK